MPGHSVSTPGGGRRARGGDPGRWTAGARQGPPSVEPVSARLVHAAPAPPSRISPSASRLRPPCPAHRAPLQAGQGSLVTPPRPGLPHPLLAASSVFSPRPPPQSLRLGHPYLLFLLVPILLLFFFFLFPPNALRPRRPFDSEPGPSPRGKAGSYDSAPRNPAPGSPPAPPNLGGFLRGVAPSQGHPLARPLAVPAVLPEVRGDPGGSGPARPLKRPVSAGAHGGFPDLPWPRQLRSGEVPPFPGIAAPGVRAGVRAHRASSRSVARAPPGRWAGGLPRGVGPAAARLPARRPQLRPARPIPERGGGKESWRLEGDTTQGQVPEAVSTETARTERTGL